MLWDWTKPFKNWGTPLSFALTTLIVNLMLALYFAVIYYWVDNNYNETDESLLAGIHKAGKTDISNYIYFSIIITSTLGLGELVPRKDPKPSYAMRFVVCTQIMLTLFVNDFIDSTENMLLS